MLPPTTERPRDSFGPLILGLATGTQGHQESLAFYELALLTCYLTAYLRERSRAQVQPLHSKNTKVARTTPACGERRYVVSIGTYVPAALKDR